MQVFAGTEKRLQNNDEKLFAIILFIVAAGMSGLGHWIFGWSFYEMFFYVVLGAAARATLELMGVL